MATNGTVTIEKKNKHLNAKCTQHVLVNKSPKRKINLYLSIDMYVECNMHQATIQNKNVVSKGTSERDNIIYYKESL